MANIRLNKRINITIINTILIILISLHIKSIKNEVNILLKKFRKIYKFFVLPAYFIYEKLTFLTR